MSSISEMIALAKFKQSQETGIDTMQRVSDLVKSITDIGRQRQEREKSQRLRDYIKRGLEAGELEADFKISPEGTITQEYKTKNEKEKENYVNDINNAKTRIQQGEDFNLVTGELKGKYGNKHSERTDRYLAQFAPEGTNINLDISDPTGLSSEQQVQARALAKRIYGVRGAQLGLPAIYEEMRKGKSIDKIEDDLRYAGQSPEFTGPVRNAAQTMLISTSQDKAQTAMDYIDDLLSRGDTEGTKQQLKRLARTQAGMEEQRAVVGKERTIKLLDEIQDDFNKLEQMGIDTNIFTGTAEQIAAKVGTVINPEARKLATKIMSAVQNYRRSMTGVQFGMPENKEYQIMFPKITRTANFNTANINALREVMQGDLDNFYALAMGENNYQSLFGAGMRGQTQGDIRSQYNTLREQGISAEEAKRRLGI